MDKTLPIFVQNDIDATIITESGFTDVRLLTENTNFMGITLHKTNGEHVENLSQFPQNIQDFVGSVCGVVFEAEDEQTLYLAGDTLWNDDVKAAIDGYQPQVIVLNDGGNALADLGRVVMDKTDILAVAQHSPAHSLPFTWKPSITGYCLGLTCVSLPKSRLFQTDLPSQQMVKHLPFKVQRTPINNECPFSILQKPPRFL